MLLVQAFFWGVWMIIPVILIDQAAHYLMIDGARSIRRMIAYSFVFVAFVYQLSVFLPLRFSVLRKMRHKTPSTGILYAVVITLGLTSIYAIYYSLLGNKSGLSEHFFWSMGPVSMAIAVITGFFTGLGDIRKNQFIDSMTGLGAATVFFGIYRFSLLSSDVLLFWMFVTVTVFISFILFRKSLQKTAEQH